MTLEEYDEYLHGRSDYIKATKKDSSNERKVSVTSWPRACTVMKYQEQFMQRDAKSDIGAESFKWMDIVRQRDAAFTAELK